MSNQYAVIGAGFSALASATVLADKGQDVHVYEKHEMAGGRARQFHSNGFTYDMGPSWYWMPDVFESYFNRFGKSTRDYYDLVRLSPSYKVFFGENDTISLPSNWEELKELFESLESGSSKKLETFIADAAYKYQVGVNRLVYQPSLSPFEFIQSDILKDMFRLSLFAPISKQIDSDFKSERIRQLLKFPVLFLGAKPENTPALYSLMNYADLKLGTWYPMGGMHKVVEAMYRLALEKGVQFHFNSNVDAIWMKGDKAGGLMVNNQKQRADHIIAGADYEHVDRQLLPNGKSSYSDQYWSKRTLAPSALIFYLGVNKRIENLEHHNLFFDRDFARHAVEIYDTNQWPSDPLFYVCAPSKTDDTVAPEGMENLFVLMPIAPDLKDTEQIREAYFDLLIQRMEKLTGVSIADHIIDKRSYCIRDFKSDYNSFKGNAYGLANTLRQTAFLKPKIRSKKVSNLFFTGQLTTPGPGVPPSLISGQVVSDYILNL